MYSTLIPQIKTLLDSLIGTGVDPTKPLATVYDYPESKITGFPAVVFAPISLGNSYLSVQENLLEYQFKMMVICETKVSGIETAFNTILANAVDRVMDKFASEWNGGVTSDGHRIWSVVESGDWYVNETQDGETVVAELNLAIKLTNNI